MKKVLIPLVVLLICAFIITSCNSTSSPTPTKPAATTPAVTTAAATTSAATAPATTKPAATAPGATTPAVTTPVVTTPVAGKQISGGTLRYISSQVPGTPIGWMAETFGASTSTMQLAMEFCLKEMLDGTLVPHLALSYDVDPSRINPA